MDPTCKGGQHDGLREQREDDSTDPPAAPRFGFEGTQELEDPTTVPAPQPPALPAATAAARAGGGGGALAAPSIGGHAAVAAGGVAAVVHPPRPPQTTTTAAKSQGFGGAAGSAPSSFQFTFGAGASGGAAKGRMGRGRGGDGRVFAMQRHWHVLHATSVTLAPATHTRTCTCISPHRQQHYKRRWRGVM